MLAHENISVELNTDFFANKEAYLNDYDKVVFTGMIDQFFDYKLGELEYRSLRFETEVLDEDNYQGNAVVNYTDAETPFTRIIEHKHFEFGKGEKGIVFLIVNWVVRFVTPLPVSWVFPGNNRFAFFTLTKFKVFVFNNPGKGCFCIRIVNHRVTLVVIFV